MFGTEKWFPVVQRYHLALIMTILQTTVQAYIVVPMDQMCVPKHMEMNRAPILRLTGNGTKSAALLEVNQNHNHPMKCSLEVFGPSGYIISVHFTPRSGIENKDYTRETVKLLSEQDCLFNVDSVGRETTWQTDLCTFSDVSFSELLFHQSLSLSWTLPASKSYRKLRFSHIVLTMVARGVRKCGHIGKFPCWKQAKYSLFCISSEFACDGHVNCPREAIDEDPDMCSEKNPGREVARENAVTPSTTDSQPDNDPDEDSLTKALTRYGPWGYLMLGTLICGALLMLCGLWECCCRPHKTHTPTATPQNTTVYIISGQQANDEIQLPPEAAIAPPTYEELDQPPDYNSLFPEKKNCEEEQDRTQPYA